MIIVRASSGSRVRARRGTLKRALLTLAVAGTWVIPALASAGISSATKCEIQQNVVTGKYAFCLSQAEAALAKTGAAEEYTAAVGDCDQELQRMYGRYERASRGTCPYRPDPDAVEPTLMWNLLRDCASAVASGVGGDPFPPEASTCPTELAACDADRSACNAESGTCAGGLATCNDGVDSCNFDLGNCNASVTGCGDARATCDGDLAACDQAGATCSASLDACSGSAAHCLSSLGACGIDLGGCRGAEAACDSSLAACSASLETCDDDLAATNANLVTCENDLPDGTALPAAVAVGKTFSSAAGINLAGTMPERGAVTLTPGRVDQAIASGLHNGSGKCAGDVDLLAANVKSGVSMFGVVGSFAPSNGSLVRTGVTSCYTSAGSFTTCAGSGQDGELRKGVAISYTDNGNGTITDNVTGLMWEKLDDNNVGGIHDMDTAYTWNGAFGKISLLNAGSGFAGYNDWRLPNVRELLSLNNWGASLPSVSTAFHASCTAGCTTTTCSCTYSDDHWSSTTYTPSRDAAVTVGPIGSSAFQKIAELRVRAVRAGS